MKQITFHDRDYRYRLFGKSKSRYIFKRYHAVLLIGALLGVIGAVALIPDEAGATRSNVLAFDLNIAPKSSSRSQSLALPRLKPKDEVSTTAPLNKSVSVTPSSPEPVAKIPEPKASNPTITENIAWQTIKVKSGDSLATIFSRAGVSAKQLHSIIALSGDTKKLKRIFPGDELKVSVNSQGELKHLRYEIDDTQTLHVSRSEEGFKSEIISAPLTIRLTYSSGTIDSSLFLAAQKAGLPDRLTMELAGIFGWDVDFALDIRKGDSFSLMYEELYRDGNKLKNGNIVAAEFTNQSKTYRAVRYNNGSGRADYFTPDGVSMRKTFLRAPVDFTRISSKFKRGRKHPILNRIRAHRGVDYAASRGTPVRTTGDGKIAYRGRKGGYGKTVVIQHGSQYSTLYAHLSNYARGKRSGTRVKQGQIIGYVGQTGLATGPHLHYEFRVNGVHRNPLTVKFPNAKPLPKKNKADFQKVATTLLTQLDQYKKTRLALNHP